MINTKLNFFFLNDCMKLQNKTVILSLLLYVLTVATPPSSKVRKPVTASGILALTHSPLLFKGKTGSASKRTPNFKGKMYSAGVVQFCFYFFQLLKGTC